MLQRVRAQLRQVAVQMARRPELCCGAILLTCALILPLTLTCGRAKSVVALARAPVRFFPEGPVLDLFLGQLEEAERLRAEADVSLLFYYAPWCAHSITARQHVQETALRLEGEVQFVAVNCWWHQGKCRKQKSFFQYPVIHLYYWRFGPIEYRGPLQAEYLQSFIQRVSTPLTYLPTSRALHSFLTQQQQGVVGYFQFNSSPQPAGYISFLLSALHALRRDHQGAVRFAVVTNQAVAEAVSLREDESVYLHRRLNSSLVFPRAQRNFSAQAVCDWVFENMESVVHWIQPTGAKSYSLEAELQKGPALLTFLPHNPLSANQLLEQVTAVALRYHSCGPEVGPSSVPRCCRSLWASECVCEVCVSLSHCWALSVCVELVQASSGCRSVQSSYGPAGRVSVCCRSPRASRARPLPLPLPLPHDGLRGLQCRSNRTLRFLLLDSELHWPLALRLGATERHGPFITIISLRDETHHVLKHTDALEQFVQNFSVPFSPLHRHLMGQRRPPLPQALIQEVTSDSFLDTVMDPQRDVLLLYYSGWCGFCSLLNHVFLTLARLLQGSGALLLARVDVGRNDLPWEFMVDRLPSVLFFPKHRKQMSVKFPENTPMTVPNLLRFVLQHAGHAPWVESGRGAESAGGVESVGGAEPAGGAESVGGAESASVMWAELQRLQRDLSSLHRARLLSLDSQNAERRAQSGRLEDQYREKRRELALRLQERALTSDLLEQSPLLRLMLRALREQDRPDGQCEAS